MGTDVDTVAFPRGDYHAEPSNRRAYWGPKDRVIDTPVLPLASLSSRLEGPVLIDCDDTSIVVPPRATVEPGPRESVIIELPEE